MGLTRSRKKESALELFTGENPISPEVIELLGTLDLASIILSPNETPLYYSQSAQTLGIIRNERVEAENLLALIRAVRRTGRSQSGTIEILKGPIGEGSRQFAVKVAPLGSDGLMLATFSDESESERVAAVRRDFVSNVSHELKTPIGALSLLSEAVMEAANEPEAVLKFASRMKLEAKRLTELVQEIINLSRLQDADPLLDAITVDIDEVVDQAIAQSELHAIDRNIEILRGTRSFVSVVGDRTHLIMAVANLLENAINYSPDGTTVSINTTVDSNIVTITIVDQGIGIAENEIERIFERFYRVDPARSRETGGTGLGLSIVKHVANNHGGDISVWSSPGVGSTFSLRLPVGNEENVES
jgi:two-component system sensor histidine kinase SenX3